MTDTATPKLDKPGAGVPFWQRIFFTYYLARVVAAKSDWKANREGFLILSRKLLEEVRDLDNTALTTRVLVPKQPGLEDSSRYWSAAMVLEHLCITHKPMADMSVALSKGIVPDSDIDTASVKPKGDQDPRQTIDQFRSLVMSLPDSMDSRVGDRNSKVTKYHPWFGPFNALQWQWLLMSHSAIHLRQMREITKQLKK